MFNRLNTWIHQNKLITLLFIIIAWFVGRSLYSPQFLSYPLSGISNDSSAEYGVTAPSMGRGFALPKAGGGIMPPYQPAPPTDTQDRLVIKDTFLSLLVKDVSQFIPQVEEVAVQLGGYLVDSNLNQPEGAATGSITIRVPVDKRQEALDQLKSFSVKTVSETISGQDVTDQYVDLQSQLDTLHTSKSKFEAILNSATEIQDILQVQRELISLQSEIDSYLGQQQYLEGSANLSKITVYASTDELALPYTPDQPWRPEAIFKQAVRSLVSNARQLGTAAIWLVVYSPVLLLVYFLYWLIKRYQLKSPKNF